MRNRITIKKTVKIISVLLSVILFLSVCGCGNSKKVKPNLSLDIKEKEVIEDGARYNMYNIKIGANTFLNLTRAMNKELTRLFRIHDKDKVKGLTFKIIDGIIKIVSLERMCDR